MKRLALLVLAAALSLPAFSAPFLLADPYPSTGVQPDSFGLIVGTAAPVACAVVTSSAGVAPKCDLAALNTGTYTLKIVATKTSTCTSTSTSGTCTQGGSATSAPFAFSVTSGAVSAPSTPTLSAQ